MLGTGQSRHNTHTGQTTVRQGDMLIDGSLRVRGDLIIDGNVTFNEDVVINGDLTIAAP
jgi:cytoskeletal protein CcmA (bactofilin family)